MTWGMVDLVICNNQMGFLLSKCHQDSAMCKQAERFGYVYNDFDSHLLLNGFGQSNN